MYLCKHLVRHFGVIIVYYIRKSLILNTEIGVSYADNIEHWRTYYTILQQRVINTQLMRMGCFYVTLKYFMSCTPQHFYSG